MDLFGFPMHACAATGCSHASHVPAEKRAAVMRLEALYLTAARLASKDDLADAVGVVQTDGETPDKHDKFLHAELALTAALGAFLIKVEKEIVSPKITAFFTAEGEAFDAVGFRAAMEEVSSEIKAKIGAAGEDTAIRREVHALVEEAFTAGETAVAKGILAGSNSAAAIKDALTNSTLGFIGDFTEKHATPTIERALLNHLATPLPEASLARPDLLPMGKIVTDTFDAQGDAYARLVANACTSRTYHYALTKAGQLQGYTTATLFVVLDDKTSDICDALSGQSWHLSDVVMKIEAAAQAQTTEELKAVSPWYTPDKDLTAQQNADRYLAEVGVPVPPLHGNCRSTLILS